MKNNKLISLILVCAITLCCFTVVPVSAEQSEGEQIEIVAQNIVYGEKIQIAYAVNCTLDEAENVTVKYFDENGGEHTAELYKNGEMLYQDVYPIFVTEGFHANHFTDVISAVAYTGDTIPESAVYKTYSVGEYLYARLYKSGFIDKTEEDGEDYDRKQLYLALMNYGTYAQKVIDGDDAGTLLSDYCYLWTTDEKVSINGADSALVAPGESVTLLGADAFILTGINGESSGTGNTYVAEQGFVGAIVSNDGDAPIVSGFEDGELESDYITNIIGLGDSGDKAVADFTEGEMAGYVGSYVTLSVTEDPTDATNKVLCATKVRQPTSGSSSNGTASYTSKTRVALSNEVQTGEYYTFKTDLYISNVQYDVTIFNIVGSDGKKLVSLRFYNETVNTFYVMTNNADGATDCTGSAQLKDADGNTLKYSTNTWYTLRFEWYRSGEAATTMAKVYICERGGEEVCIFSGNMWNYYGIDQRTVSYVEIQHRSARAGITYFDNVSFTRTAGIYEEEATE